MALWRQPGFPNEKPIDVNGPPGQPDRGVAMAVVSHRGPDFTYSGCANGASDDQLIKFTGVEASQAVGQHALRIRRLAGGSPMAPVRIARTLRKISCTLTPSFIKRAKISTDDILSGLYGEDLTGVQDVVGIHMSIYQPGVRIRMPLNSFILKARLLEKSPISCPVWPPAMRRGRMVYTRPEAFYMNFLVN